MKDLTEIFFSDGSRGSVSSLGSLPSVSERMEEIARRLEGKRVAVFLDYDGTLTPIVKRPESAVLSGEMRGTVERLAVWCPVAVISGRDLADVRDRVGIDTVFYAGSHGFDIAGPRDMPVENQVGIDFLPLLDRAEQALRERLSGIAGARIERKRLSVAVHYREVADEAVGSVKAVVDAVWRNNEKLKKSQGKKVYELQPRIDWHKGKALLWLLRELHLDTPDTVPLYIGDDITDEDAFRALGDQGIGIVVVEGSESTRTTRARYALRDPDDVQDFLKTLTRMLSRKTRT